MVHNQAANFRTLATQFVPGSIALALATLALFGLRLDGIRLFDRNRAGRHQQAGSRRW
jgi:hypothetical protein